MCFLSKNIIVLAFVLFMSAISFTASAQEDFMEPAIDNTAVDEVAQEIIVAPEEILPVVTLTGDPMIENMVRRSLIQKPAIETAQIPSLFFTSWELGLIQDARKGLATRAPTNSEVERSMEDAANGTRPPRGPRELAVGGIIYTSSSDWTVWLNGQKITPNRLPPEILDISVRKDHVRLKWFDAYTNQIFPIKIKTHQRFNIDTRIFLPG